MPEYVYRAADENGLIIRNRITEKSKQSLIRRLKANGMTPIEVTQVSFGKYKKSNQESIAKVEELMKIADATAIEKKKNKRSFSVKEKVRMALSINEKVTTRDIVVFTQNFYLLKKAGFNNIHALNTLVKSTENTTLRGILEDVLSGVEAGDYMYTTMEYYSDIFPYIYINLVKVGELSGSLEESLKQAVGYLDSSNALNKKIKQILIPNITQFVALFVILMVGSVYIVPIIQNVFAEMGSAETLPAITLAFSKFLTQVQKFWFIPVGIIAIIIGVLFMYIKTPKGRYNWDYFKYRMPIFGQLIFAIDFSRFSKAMVLNLKNGMRIQEAMEVSKNVVKNYVMLSIIETSINNIITGDSWVKPFEDSGLPSPMVTEMLKIGMQTDLPMMMEKMVEYMDMDIDNILAKIVKVLPQVMYIFIGALLIFITIVVLVPCIQVYMGTFLFSAAGV